MRKLRNKLVLYIGVQDNQMGALVVAPLSCRVPVSWNVGVKLQTDDGCVNN